MVTQLHAYYCAPIGFWGLVTTPIMMGSPICIFFVNIIKHTSEIYSTIWLGLLSVIVSNTYTLIRNNGIK